MRKLSYGVALLCAGVVGAATMAVLRPAQVVHVEVAAKPQAVARYVVPARVSGTAQLGPVKAEPRAEAAPARKTVRARTTRPTVSLYEHTTSMVVLRAQGCRAGKARQHGLVILAFGKPAFRGGLYGTIIFTDRFAKNRAITWAMKAFAQGYVDCVPKASRARITLARGTSNYDPSVPSTYSAGRQWARQTAAFGQYLKRHGFEGRVRAAAAIDAEPAWDRHFRKTRDFFRGFRSMKTGYLLYNYGSLDGGVGSIWSLRQAYYVSGGMRYARAVPEIYNGEMAAQWAALSRLSVQRYGKPIAFAGLMTQYKSNCRRCGFTAKQARRALVRELAKHPKTRVRHLAAATNIRWAHALSD